MGVKGVRIMAVLKMGERIEMTVTMKGIYEFSAPSYSGWGTETRYIYTMVTEDNTFVWKTTTFMTLKVRDDVAGWETDTKGRKWRHDKINRDDVIRIKATVKGFGEYKGEPQIELTRVSVVERTFKGKTPEEYEAERKASAEAKIQAQKDSLQGEDFMWRMPYKQYKEHYSDCETLYGSFEKRDYEPATIVVIIRENRLVPSGVRGMHFHGYEFNFIVDGKKYRQVYRAVSEDNAYKRLMKENPTATDIEPGKIYDYGA